MRSRRARALTAAALLWAAAPFPARAEELCPRIKLVGPKVDLNEVEKRLVCGYDKSEGWKTVPLNQAQYFLTAFLQRRGYHYPRFSAENDQLTVDVGTMTHITRLEGHGLEGLYDFGKKRGIVGKPLTPEQLDLLKSDVNTRLQEQGYECPTLKLDADARTGVVTVTGTPGIYYIMTYVHAPKIDKLDPGVFERWRAFDYGYPVDTRLLSLTSSRIMQEALFQSAYYELKCSTAGLAVTQRVVEAKPHLVTIALGLDTEGYARARAQWRDSRIGYRASSMEATLFSSYREQEFDALMHYYLRPSDRINLMPAYTARRDNENQFETVEQQATVSPNWTWDNQRLHLDVTGGPAFDYFNTIRGIGPPNDTFFAFNTKVTAMSHLFEYYQRDPRIGWQLGFESSSRETGVYSGLTAHRLRVWGQKLWNVGRYDPPLLVLADRGWAGTISARRDRAFAQLPPTQRFFLGGDADLRGAIRQSLPGDGLGFLSVVYDGLELRLTDVLPFKLQPLLFCDAAMASRNAWDLDKDIYLSPGTGFRWASPVGAVRFTVARGLQARNTPENPAGFPRWQFFATFGTEF
jgi:translocation and assembly module TamA